MNFFSQLRRDFTYGLVGSTRVTEYSFKAGWTDAVKCMGPQRLICYLSCYVQMNMYVPWQKLNFTYEIGS